MVDYVRKLGGCGNYRFSIRSGDLGPIAEFGSNGKAETRTAQTVILAHRENSVRDLTSLHKSPEMS